MSAQLFPLGYRMVLRNEDESEYWLEYRNTNGVIGWYNPITNECEIVELAK